MKRIWACILLLALCLTLCACGEKAAEAPESGAEPVGQGGSEEASPAAEPEIPVVISEVMPVNRATLADENDAFPCWIELQNRGTEAVSLDGCTLACGKGSWELTGVRLEPGEYRVLFCPEKKSGFALSAGQQLRLLSPGGRELDALALPETEADVSLTREGLCFWPTPGFENGSEGYEAFQQSREPRGLAIGEVCVSDPKGDWVELVNLSDQSLSLGDYYLSDKSGSRLLYALPEQELQPGARAVIAMEQANFGLNNQRDQLFLSRIDGTIMDYVNLHDIPAGGSLGRSEGRSGFWYYAAATPGAANGEGLRRVSDMPVPLERDGIYNDVTEVTVTLTAKGEIHYTTDGSAPTAASPLYEGPLTLTKTGVLRAISLEEGAFPSRVLSLSYIINENHTLPVMSLVAAPGDLFGRKGIYDNVDIDGEKLGAVMFYDGEQSFAIDCGIRPHGATSRLYQPKKTLKLEFRSRYGGRLHYDLFENGVTEFSSLLVRAPAESGGSTMMRDCLMHEIAEECFPALCVQDHRYAVLYINGEYWGVYNLREAHSRQHYANHYGVDEDTVEQYRNAWGKETGFDKVVIFARNNSLRIDKNYEQVAARLDVDSVIGWAILEAYCGNIDAHSSNMRFYYTFSDQKLHYALVDLDQGFEDYPSFYNAFDMGYLYNDLLYMLMENGGFRAEFLRQMGEAFDGPLKEENVSARIDELEEELRPEMARDRERWGSNITNWERKVDVLRRYLFDYGGRRKLMVTSLREYIGSTPEFREWVKDHQY